MRIDIKGGGSGKGYGNYILRENKKNVDFSKIKVLSGDMKLGDEIVKSSNYKDNSFNIVLEFKGKISDDKAKAVTGEFEKLFMHGFSREEYHLDAVLHQDTANSHVHIRIPKKNLLTDTTLRLYMDKTDRARINLIRDYIEEKFNLEKMKDNLRLQPKPKAEIIQEWRKKRKQKPFNFSKKKGRDEAQNYIVDYIKELHEADLINSIDDVKNLVCDLDLKFVKAGHDFKTDTHYLTFENSTGKIALKGELFNEQFYTEFEKKDREKQINDNRRPAGTGQRTITSFQELTHSLEKALNKRYEEVTKRYKASRRRARERNMGIQRERPKNDSRRAEQSEQAIQHHNSAANNSIISSTIIPDNKKLEREANSERVDDTKKEPLSRPAGGQIYRYTSNRYKALKKQKALLYPNRPGEIDGTHRNANARHGTTTERERPKRTSSYERFRESRESLYSKARAVVQDRANERYRRRQHIEAINGARETVTELESEISRRYRNIDQESESLIESANELTRAIDKQIRRKNIQEEDYYMPSM